MKSVAEQEGVILVMGVDDVDTLAGQSKSASSALLEQSDKPSQTQEMLM
jgi:hypothetical protein